MVKKLTKKRNNRKKAIKRRQSKRLALRRQIGGNGNIADSTHLYYYYFNVTRKLELTKPFLEKIRAFFEDFYQNTVGKLYKEKLYQELARTLGYCPPKSAKKRFWLSKDNYNSIEINETTGNITGSKQLGNPYFCSSFGTCPEVNNRFIQCFNYLSNLYKNLSTEEVAKETIKAYIESNNLKDIFISVLEHLDTPTPDFDDDQKIKIFKFNVLMSWYIRGFKKYFIPVHLHAMVDYFGSKHLSVGSTLPDLISLEILAATDEESKYVARNKSKKTKKALTTIINEFTNKSNK